ncbi:MAG: GNAT family N-acetyltransferase [Pseudomonadota bacterium]
MSDGDIIREVDGSKGRYVMTTPDGVAELGYSIMSAALVIADHTTVDEGLRGTGAGAKLAARFVADAQEEGFKIMPLCPFVNAERRKHPEWAEVFAT